MYDQFYGFTERPFQSSADPHFFVETATHGEALSYLDYGLAQASGAVLICGAEGTGKSTLAQYWAEGLDTARFHILDMSVKNDPTLSFAEHLSELLDLPDSFLTIDQWLMAVAERLRDEIWAGRRSLLIVDDVESLPTDALAQFQLLAAMHHDGQALLQIFLFGQPSFEARLRQDADMASLRNMIGASHHLSVVQVDELEHYVYHRLSKVGWDDRPIFRQDAFAILLAQSGGLPSRINILLNRVLLNGALEEVLEIGGHHLVQAIAELTAEGKWEPLPEPVFVSDTVAQAVAALEEDEGEVEPQPESQAQAEPDAANPALAQDVREAIAYTDSMTAQPCAIAAPLFTMQPMVAGDADGDLADLRRRVDELEAKLLEQDAAMRRMIDVLLNWVEPDGMNPAVAANAAMALAGRTAFALHDIADLHNA
jgi:type II secretory pathway predicted ATPase ExeA